MENLLATLTQYGALGIMCALLIYDVMFLQKKILSVVEQNTKAMEMMKIIIQKCDKPSS